MSYIALYPLSFSDFTFWCHPRKGFIQLYFFTRGHWTAMLALIKVDEIAQNLKHFYMEKIFKNGAIFWE